MTGVTLGYGYRPGIALVWLALVLAISIGLVTGVAGPNELATRVPGGPCSTIEQVGLALNAATPLFKPDPQNRCQLTATADLGQVIILATWILQALAWAFATLFVAGFTGLVRKPHRPTDALRRATTTGSAVAHPPRTPPDHPFIAGGGRGLSEQPRQRARNSSTRSSTRAAEVAS